MKKVFWASIVLITVGVCIYYFVLPFFTSVVIDDALPVPLSVDSRDTSTTSLTEKKPEVAVEKKNVPIVQDTGKVSEVNTPIQTKNAVTNTSAPPSAIVPQKTFPIATVVGTVGHKASGTVRLVESDGTRYIRYENFKTINGPDLYVYLASNIEATEFVSLGKLKGTEGNINYIVPSTVDITKHPYILIWCKQFGVLFNSAKII